MESMMTVRQVAELLGVHENWVYDQAANGELPSYKIGGARRFDPDELRGWIAEHRERENGRQRPNRSPRRTIATSAALRDAQNDEEQSKQKRRRRASRKRDSATRVDDERQPRLFES